MKLEYNSQTNKLELIGSYYDSPSYSSPEEVISSYEYHGTRQLKHGQILDSSEVVEGTAIEHTKGLSVLRPEEVELYKNSNAVTRTVYLDAKTEAQPISPSRENGIVEPEAVREENLSTIIDKYVSELANHDVIKDVIRTRFNKFENWFKTQGYTITKLNQQ